MELFDDPITVPCCGKAFSRLPLALYLGKTNRCPTCNNNLETFDPSECIKNTVLASMVDNIAKIDIVPKNGKKETIMVDDCLNIVKQNIIETINQTGNNIIKKLETEIRNKIIENLTTCEKNSQEHFYGKMGNDEIMRLFGKEWQMDYRYNPSQDTNCERYGIRPNNNSNRWFYDTIHPNNYCQSCASRNHNIIDNNILRKELCEYVSKYINNMEQEYIIHMEIITWLSNCSSCSRTTNPPPKENHHTDIMFITNKCNVLKCNYWKNSNPSQYKWVFNMTDIIKTDILLNKIFIDIIKTNSYIQFIDRARSVTNNYNIMPYINKYKVVSDIVKQYWASNNIGNIKLKLADTENELEKANNNIVNLNKQIDTKDIEINKLQSQNNDLHRQLEELEQFQKCLQMVSTQIRKPE